MAAVIGKYAAKKMLGKQMQKYRKNEPVGRTDPYFVYVEDPKKPGKMKKMKKQIPDYIPDHDAEILAKMRKRSYALDCCLFSFMGVRFGWSSVIGLIPAAGDVIDALLAFALYWRIRRVKCGLGGSVEMMMILNIIGDFLIGLVPFVGDVVDAAFKANTRNVRLLEERLDEAYRPDKQKVSPPAAVLQDLSDAEDEALPQHRTDGANEPRRPEPARQPAETRGGAAPEKRQQGSFGFGRRDRQPDLEAGNHGRR